MTPKERAVHLVDKYLNMKRIKMSDYSVIYLPTAKECALIVVEEIIKEFGTYFKVNIEGNYMSYWEKVKEEINNL